MPRRNLARRFEPRYGVSDPMLEMEVSYVKHEVEDYRLYSMSELENRLTDRHRDLITVEAELEFSLKQLSDRDRLIVRNLIARDFWHIAKLFEKYLRSDEIEPFEPNTGKFIDIEVNAEPVGIIPFKETLFD